MLCNRPTRMGVRVREDVGRVRAYRPSPNRVKRAPARVRHSSSEDSGSGLGLERVCTDPRKIMVLETCCYCCIQCGTRRQHSKLCISTQCRPRHLYGRRSFHAERCRAARGANSACSLSSSAFRLTASAASLSSFSDTIASISEVLSAA